MLRLTQMKVVLILLFVLFVAGCTDKNAVRQLGRSLASVSVLTINLRAIYDEPCRIADGRWNNRYSRIATWMKDTKSIPDVIVLQEATGWGWCPTNFNLLPDYAAINHLITSIKTEAGASYRIAYLQGRQAGGLGNCGIGGGVLGGCNLFIGSAVLYNPDVLRNVTGAIPDASAPHDSPLTDTHLRRSLPCCNPAADQTQVCNLIDGPKQMDKCSRETGGGPVWVTKGAAFARFEHRRMPAQFVHIYNIHISPADSVGVNQFISVMESRFAEGRLYPPIMAGDFNMSLEETKAAFPMFEVAGVIDITHDAVMVGKGDIFPSAYKVNAQSIIVRKGTLCGASVSELWSDHCSVFSTFVPALE